MKQSIMTFLVMLLFIAPVWSDDAYEYELNGVDAKYVSDGDTPFISIRMFGIDAPESEQMCERANGSCYKCGKRSKEVLDGLLTDEATYKFTGETTYGRPVVTIFLNQLDVNKEMVRQGHAIVYERFLSGDMKDDYLGAQDEAKSLNKGIWQGKFIMPAKWRRGERLSCEAN